MKKYTFFLLITSSLIINANIYQDSLPEPFKSIELLPFDPHGWFAQANEKKLRELITSRPIKTIIEVGTWLGLSTRFMAALLPSEGKLYGVDHFLGSTEINLGSHSNDRVTTMYQQFLSNVIHAQLTDKIVPIRMSSLEAAKALNIKADLIYIDASHDEESVYNDIIAWYPKLTPDGILCGDDYGGGGDELPIKKAVHHAAITLNKRVKTEGNWFWYFEPN